HLPPASGAVPPELASYTATASQSDSVLALALGGSTADPATLARIAAVRTAPGTAAADAEAVLGRVREQVDEALALAAAGRHEDASAMAFDSYMTFEQVERDVRAKNPSLADGLETAFATLRTRTAGGATAAELDGVCATLFAGLENAQRALGDTLSPTSLFVQSLVLLLREGLEAILIVGALLTFLVKSGAAHRRRHIHLGVAAALVASLVTAVLLETVIHLSPARREVIEGLTMVVAAGVLFYVSYWLLSKVEVVRWTHFVKSKVHDAVTSGSAFALASAAFLAVYREGFETVLFYKALVLAGAPGQTLVPVVAGIVLGSVLLGLVYLGINRFGVKIPLKPFFALTGAFLYYMAFVFAGRGVAELQEGGLIPTTVLPWAPRIPALGIYPTLESLLAQGLLLALFVGALAWTFLVAPRRMRVTSVLVPDPAERPAPAPVAVDPAVVEGVAVAAADARTEMVRSLERMEGDLAALRAEVERMRDQVKRGSDAPGSSRR
ncbi:MAG: FTR1 family iron permease, partial [Gemmatimonadales bacterium]|nr:FTR1 family iron permease [Gemmatimonadales bacterium]